LICRLDWELRQREEWWKERDERLNDTAAKIEKETEKKTDMDRRRQDSEKDAREKLNKTLMERLDDICRKKFKKEEDHRERKKEGLMKG
jgi:hypothetical protein